MPCPRHHLAAQADGRCALCHREQRARDAVDVRGTDRRIHRGLRRLIAVMAGVATFALLLAWCDTR